MSDESNILTQKAEETGFLQDVVDVLKAFGIDEKNDLLIDQRMGVYRYRAYFP